MPVFLFTDIEASTRKWEKFGGTMAKVLVKHDAILKQNIEKFGGKIIKHTGDGIFAVFIDGNPLECAIEIQKQIAAENWGEIGELRVRMAIHAGNAEKRGEDYFGPVINRTARLLSTGYGGQVLLTPEVMRLCSLPPGASLDDLGVHLLKDLSEPQPVYGLLHPDIPLKKFPELLSLSAHPHNLPPQPTPFVGREKELAEMNLIFENPECRLLTLAGPGGTGKTRLAVQFAADKIEDYHNGVYFIHLAPVNSSDFLVSTIGEALKFSFYNREDPKNQLLNYLREKNILLVMDNFEHLIEGAKLVSEILENAPKIKIIVTSRERLQLLEEWVMEVQGLEIPDSKENLLSENFSSVQLFLQNAVKVKPGFSPSEADIISIIEICNLVGGLPLGIELASIWVRSLSCAEIASEIKENMDFLETRLRNVSERHRSLRGVFQYSWNLLNDTEKNIYKKLAIFPGAFDREAAEKITGAVLNSLSSLADKSLLRINQNDRFELLSVLRKYAWEKLAEKDEREAVQTLFYEYFASFLAARRELIRSEKQIETLKEISDEIENIRQAWYFALQKEEITILDIMIDGLFLYYELRSWFKEGEELFENCINKLESSLLPGENNLQRQLLLGKLYVRLARFSFRLGSHYKAKKYLDKCLPVFRNNNQRSELAFYFNNMADVFRVLGNYSDAEQFYHKSLDIYTQIGSNIGISTALANKGIVCYEQGNYKEAKEIWHDALQIRRDTKEPSAIASSLNNLANVAYQLGEYKEVKKLHMESLEIRKKTGDQMGIANSLNNLALVSHALGEFETAEKYHLESINIFRNIGDRNGLAIALNNLGNMLCTLKKYPEAEKYCEESLEIRKSTADKLGIAYSLNNLAQIYYNSGEKQKAENYYLEALEIAEEIKAISLKLDILLGLARFLEQDKGSTLMTYIFSHSSTYQETRDRAEQILLESGPFNSTGPVDLDQVVTDFLKG
jgi:predicted ATPase/class 3 adenylate cyclase/Tfp pilus assembly protein PilF